jgi:hypothetical protein
MRQRSRLSPRNELRVRVALGLGWIAAGAGTALTSHDYPAGDYRASREFWVLLGLVTVGIGAAILADSIRRLRVLRPEQPSGATPTEATASASSAGALQEARGQTSRTAARLSSLGRIGDVLLRLWVGVVGSAIGLLTLQSNLGGTDPSGGPSAARWIWVLLGIACCGIGVVILASALKRIASSRDIGCDEPQPPASDDV